MQSVNKKVIIAIIVVLLLLVGFFVMTRLKAPATTSTSSITSGEAAKPSSLKGLLALGTAQSCTFDNAGNAGTMYISGGKMRGDFDSTVNGKTTKSHMLVDGTTSYIWMDGEKTGFKMSFDPNAQTSSPAAASSGAQSFDPNADMNYKCGAWTADASLFTAPAGVTFTSFAIPTTNPASGSGSSSSSQCSYCDSLTGTDKAQCRSSLGCK